MSTVYESRSHVMTLAGDPKIYIPKYTQYIVAYLAGDPKRKDRDLC